MELSKKIGCKSYSRTSVVCLGVGLIGTLLPEVVWAEAQTFGSIAANITGSFASIVKLITGISYLAGVGFGAAGIMKFKQHKDNPTQIPLGQPVALLFISAALIWLPMLIQSAGVSIFGASGGTSAGAGGASGRDIFTSS